MTRIVHISDLHFGLDRADLRRPLLAAVNAARADLVVVSGDLTHRAQPDQYKEARAFLDALDARWMAVPGNHDLPAYNLAHRFIAPFSRYRRWIGSNLEPTYTDGTVAVLGLNTVDPLSWQRGRIGNRALTALCRRLETATQGRTGIVVAHHPFEHSPDSHKKLMRGAARAVAGMTASGAQMVLSGHLHGWRVEPFVERHDGRRMLQLHVGTGLSARVRDKINDFAVLTVEDGSVEIERWVNEHPMDSFAPALRLLCMRDDVDGWRIADRRKLR